MKIEFFIKKFFIISLFGCKADLNDFIHETNLAEGLKMGEAFDKPIFVYFTGYGCVGYDEFKQDLLESKAILDKLNENFVSVILHVDDRKKIEKTDTLNLGLIELSQKGLADIRKAKNIGHINTIIEIDLFNQNAQPLYAIMNSKQETLIEPFGYINKDKKQFLSKFNEGLSRFESKQKKSLRE